MASDYRTKASRGGFGGALEGLNKGIREDNKNRFKRAEKQSDRDFQTAKMMAQQMLRGEQNQFNREQQQTTWEKRRAIEEDKKLQEDFPSQYKPTRGTYKQQLDPEELATSNEFYRSMSKERSKRQKMKMEKEKLSLVRMREMAQYE